MQSLRIYLIPLLIAVFAVVIIFLSLQLDESPPIIVGDSMQPRVFPIFLMILMLVLAGFLVIHNRGTPPAPVPLEPFATWGSIALMLVFYFVTRYADFFIAIAAVIFGLCLLWGERRWWVVLLTTLVTPASIFLLFDQVLRIRFPRGIFTNWWYS